ncbi:MAG TPA: hypothetical protein DEP72_04850, partial [Clostridiales bacterium]|nr:hypothetical protein [Clostridiales bacterium]
APTVTVTANTTDTTAASSIIYTMQFSETVTGFDINDVTVNIGTKGTFTAVDGDTYTLVVTNTGSCTQIVTVEAGVCIDAGGNANTAGSKTITIDRTQPTVTMTANKVNPTTATSITYTFEFSKNVINFVIGDIEVTNGTKGIFTAVDGDTYTLVVTNSASGDQIIHLDSGVCTDVLLNESISANMTMTIDRAGPIPTITTNTTDPTNLSTVTYTIEFDEAVTGFDITDITVTNGTAGTFTAVDGNTYTLIVTNIGDCIQTVEVAAGVCQDALSNGNTIASKTITIQRAGLILAITANVVDDITNTSSITYTFEFSENVTGFEINDIIVTNGTAGTFTAVDGNTYTLIVTNTGITSQTVSVAAGVCVSQADGNPNIAATKTITIDKTPPTIVIDPKNRKTGIDNITATITVTDTNGVGYWKYKWTNTTTKPTEPIGEWETLEPIIQSTNGVWYLHVQAADTAGNISYKYSGVYIKVADGTTIPTDIIKPTIAVSPINRIADTTNITATVTITDNVKVNSWKYKWTKSNIEPTASWINGVGTVQALTQMQNGTWYLHVKAQDAKGNLEYKSFSPYIKVEEDRYGPQIRADITSREMSTSDITVNITLTDLSSGIAKYKYKWTGTTVKPTFDSTVTLAGQTTITQPITQAVDGVYYLHIEATDTKGNISYKYYGQYKKGTTQPISNQYPIGLTAANKVNFKYYIGLDQYGETRVMLVSPDGTSVDFVRGDIIDIVTNKFKSGIYYIDKNGVIRVYSAN